MDIIEPVFDKHGYPADEPLERIKWWKIQGHRDLGPLFDFVVAAWNQSYGQVSDMTGPKIREVILVTGGWSGNEDVVGALMENTMAWSIAWQQSTRGGKYSFVFEVGDDG